MKGHRKMCVGQECELKIQVITKIDEEPVKCQ
jgi:hypothetical protein